MSSETGAGKDERTISVRGGGGGDIPGNPFIVCALTNEF